MANATLDQILTQLPALDRDHLRVLRDRIDRLIESPPSEQTSPLSEAEAQKLLDERLLAQGTILRIPSPAINAAEERHPPIHVKGKPVSETIIEERR